MAEMSFIFGKGQKARTPEEARRLREFAEALMGSQRAPQNVGEGLMALANGLSARFAHNAASRGAAEGRAGAESKVGPIFSALFGSKPVSPVTPSGNKVAAALSGKPSDGAGNLPSRFDFANAEKTGKGNGTAYASFMGEVGKDLTNPYGLAAVAATGQAESGWSPTNIAGSWSDPSQSGKAGTAGGAMSWRNERLAGLQDFARNNGLDPTDPTTQARFFMQEDPTLIAGLQNARSVEEAQGLINNAWKFAGYDQPGGESARRLAYAKEYLPTFQGGGGTDTMVGSAGNDRMAPAGGGILSYANEGAIRNQPLVPGLESSLQDAVSSVYGPGYSVQVYSGGQAGKGEKGRRTGSIRHDHGRAADVYVVGPDGKRVTGDRLAPLGQYWAANKLGGVGMEMHGGGIHLDNWTTPPPGGGMHWNYADQGGRYTPAMRTAMDAGMRGELPNGAGAPLLAGRGGSDQMLGGAGNDTLAPQQMQAPQGIAPSRFDGPGSMGDPGVQAALAAERGQQPQGQGPGPLQAISRAFGFGGQPQPQEAPQFASGPSAQQFPPQPPAPTSGDTGDNGALSMENLYRVLQDPWVDEGTKRVILSEIQRQQQMADPAYQLELQKGQAEIDAIRNPKPTADWSRLDDGTLFNQRTGETRKVGPGAQKPPTVAEFYDEQTGLPYKAQWNQDTGKYERVGGTKADNKNGFRVTTSDGTVIEQGALDKQDLKNVANRVTAEQEAAAAGNSLKQMTGLLREANNNVGYSGPLSGVYGFADNFLEGVGSPLSLPGNSGSRAVMTSGGLEVALSQVQKTKGSISNTEMALFMAAAPGLANTPQGNAALFDMIDAIAERQIQRATAMETYRQQQGGSLDGFEKQWNDYINTNPLILKGDGGGIRLNIGPRQEQPVDQTNAARPPVEPAAPPAGNPGGWSNFGNVKIRVKPQ